MGSPMMNIKLVKAREGLKVDEEQLRVDLSELFKEKGDIRFWIVGRSPPKAAVELIKEIDVDQPGWEPSWKVRRIDTGEIIVVQEYDIGRKLNGMEVLAWASR